MQTMFDPLFSVTSRSSAFRPPPSSVISRWFSILCIPNK